MILNCGPGEDSWSLLDSKEIKPVYPKGNQPWIVFGRANADADAEVPILWPPDVNSCLIGKDPDINSMQSKLKSQQVILWISTNLLYMEGQKTQYSQHNAKEA